ncbi:hypothetical protein FQN57_000030 [Myotisia sp. PD_48]|nr:hypothetical protein FQN57_000030 [Myotisia sp. PD_48]
MFLQACHPGLLGFNGPVTKGFEPLNLPENFDRLSPEEQLEAAKSFEYRNTPPGEITGRSTSIFSDGELIVQGMLIRLQDEWEALVKFGVPCPLSFTAQDRLQQKEDEASWHSSVKLRSEFLQEVGAYQGWDGWVNHANYEAFKLRLEECRKKFFSHHALQPNKSNSG